MLAILAFWLGWFQWWMSEQVQATRVDIAADRVELLDSFNVMRSHIEELDSHVIDKGKARMRSVEFRLAAVCRMLHQFHSVGAACDLPAGPNFSKRGFAQEE